MYLTIKGLVLRVSVYNDTDALLSVLTHTHGKITLKARGLRSKNSPLAATCQLLAYSEFTLFRSKDIYIINEARSVSLFHNLRTDLTKLSLGTYFAQVAEVICQEDMPSPQILSLVLNSLFALTELSLSERFIKSVFEIRCACLAGYTPDLSACYQCGNEYPDMLNLKEGRLECNRCRMFDEGGIRMPLTVGALDAMRYITECEPQKIFSFRIDESSLASMSQIAESYLLTQLERGFSTLDFYKSLFI